MTEFWSSFSKWFNEKASSPLYWTYLGFFVAWNWKFFQVIFLEDASLFKRPRIEYLDSLAFSPTSIEFINMVVNLSWRLGPPIILTYIAINWLPRIHNWAFDIYSTHLFSRKLVYQRKKVKYEKEVAYLTKEEAEAKATQADQKKKIEETKTQEEKWEEEFNNTKKDDNLRGFIRLVKAIYEKGELYSMQVRDKLQNESANVLAFSETRDLIAIDEKGKIKLTNKGKYFYRQFSDSGMITSN